MATTNSLLSVSCVFLAAFFFLLQHATTQKASPEEQKMWVDRHNQYKKKKDLPPMKWDDKCEEFAINYGKERFEYCKLVHSTSEYGENLFRGQGGDFNGTFAIDQWYAEKPYYNYQTNECTPGQQCLHYVQIMWKTTDKVGCHKTLCKNGDTFIGCNYEPHGCIIGSRPF